MSGHPPETSTDPDHRGGLRIPAAGPDRPSVALATWAQRIRAGAFDLLALLPAAGLYAAGTALSLANAPLRDASGQLGSGNRGLVVVGLILVGVGGLLGFAVAVYNHIIVQGQTGQSWGKRRLGLRIVHRDTGDVIGTGTTLARQLLHLLDVVTVVGFLWPLWDPQRRTIADRIIGSVVVSER